MLNTLFMITVGLYFLSTMLCFAGAAFKKEKLRRAALDLLLVSAGLHGAYIVWRGIVAQRLPLANQFEFATALAWIVALLGVFFYFRKREQMGWIPLLCTPMAFLIQSYAALQPREITELMPALKSAWFGLHIGSAVFAYAAFAVAALLGGRYLVLEKKNDDRQQRQQPSRLHAAFRNAKAIPFQHPANERHQRFVLSRRDVDNPERKIAQRKISDPRRKKRLPNLTTVNLEIVVIHIRYFNQSSHLIFTVRQNNKGGNQCCYQNQKKSSQHASPNGSTARNCTSFRPDIHGLRQNLHLTSVPPDQSHHRYNRHICLDTTRRHCRAYHKAPKHSAKTIRQAKFQNKSVPQS